MDDLFAQLTLAGIRQDVLRNIVSPRQSQNLFDDLSDDPADWSLAQQVESEIKPPPYGSPTPVIDRPFEEASWFNAIDWPFQHWSTSRFSDGSHGVWYGAESVETTVYESAWHWWRGFLVDAGFERENVVSERKVYQVACHAALLDFRRASAAWPELLHPSDYTFTHAVGARIRHEGHPGLVIQSVRRPLGETFALFNAGLLSDPRLHCQLSYRLVEGKISVERQAGTTWLTLDAQYS